MWSDKDLAYALHLQDQYDSEEVAHAQKCSPIKRHDQSFSNLANPDLEFTDPTPNVLALFQQFDKRFFWSSLAAVTVRWSKRMTSCAGICRYQARSGFCEIALSEPLLKLRQRKDLIETLLHEMIHAYLFLSENDRDRDGHGPNFHKHMYRINQAANVNITVYHTFVEEVHHYQTHWWRCNGPCQTRKPWFGIIRRTKNRAPGPSDFWWKQHKMTCNGTFIKVKEPTPKKNKAANNDQLDIETFFPKTTKHASITENKKTPRNKKIKLDPPSAQILPAITKKRVPHSQNRVNINNKSSDIKNFTPSAQNRIDRNNKNIKKSIPPHTVEPVNKSNNNQNLITPPNTVVINKPILENIKNNDNVRENVRNHWINKYPIKNNIEKAPSKDEKLTTLNCPLCNISLKTSDLDKHVQNCLEMTKFNDFEENLTETIDLASFASSSKDSDNFKDCPVCEKQILGSNLAEHLEDCLNTTFEDDEKDCFPNRDVSIISLSDSDDEMDVNSLDKNVTNVPCPCCYKMIEENAMNNHLDQCLL